MHDLPRMGTGNNPSQATPVRLHSVPEGEKSTVRPLGTALGILTHWTPKRPYACPGARNCQATIHRGPTVWKGYAAAELWRDLPFRDWLPIVLEITERLWESMSATALRGQIWSLWRVGGDRKSKEVTGELLDIVEPKILRTDVEVAPVVCRVYRTSEIEWGVKPFLPARQLLAPISEQPPPNAAETVDPRSIPGTPEYEADQAATRELIRQSLARNGNGKSQTARGVK